MIRVPTWSNKGGSAVARFIMMNGEKQGIHESTVAKVPFGSLGININVNKGTIIRTVINPMKFCASFKVLQRLPIVKITPAYIMYPMMKYTANQIRRFDVFSTSNT